jgi:hypothetical protein
VQTTSLGSASDPQSVSDPRPLVITGVPATVAQVGVPYDYLPVVSDAPSAALTFSITNKPAWTTFNTATGELQGTPSASDVGVTNDIEISVADGVGSATVGPFSITVAAAQSTTPPSEPPTISGTPSTSALAGQPYQFTPSASDPNGNALTFVVANRPSWLTFSTTTGQLSGTPTAANIGSYANITISVSNGTLNASLPAFTITVASAANTAPPTISGNPPTSVVAGSTYDFVPTASDPAGNPLTFAIQNQPAWASFNSGTGELSGTPTVANIGSYVNIVISASDGTLAAALPAFTIDVSAAGNGPPTISGSPPTTVAVNSTYSFTPTTTDPSGNPLTFSIQNMPNWATFNTNTGTLTGKPSASNVGSYPNVVISVSDGILSASLPAFGITVAAAGSGPPTIGGNPPTAVVVGSAYSFTPTASDPAGNPLTFTIQNRPSWANFDTGSGQLSGTPTAANVGSYPNIVISVSDGILSASLPAFGITVAAAGSGPPTIGGNPPTAVVVGSTYSFTPTASDPAGNPLTFTIQNRPSWANFDTGSGQLSGTPTAASVGSYPNIVISVSDGILSASLPAFAIAVSAAAGGPPTISGNPPASVNVGAAYSFTPSASDPGDQALTFSIQNQPAWASFNTNTGQLSGTPTAANTGTYSNITISVSDGTSSASLPAFSITVTEVATGSLTVNWSAPSQNTNGTPLVNLAGYFIYYGTSANALTQRLQISNPGITTYTITGVAPGTWYVGILDYTSTGVESSFSNIGSATIQ